MNIATKKRFKSISDFEWHDIPMLSVITGPNGSGKTHLLELINEELTSRARRPGPLPMGSTVTDIDVAPSEVVFVGDSWRPFGEPAAAKLDSLTQAISTTWAAIQQFKSVPRPDHHPAGRRIRKIERALKKKVNAITYEDVLHHLAVPAIMGSSDPFDTRLSDIFYDYHVRQTEWRAQQSGPDDAYIERSGPAPWVILREILDEAALPFAFSSPDALSLREPYTFQLHHKVHGTPLKLADLSSGEKVVFSMVTWLFTSETSAHFPRLLLLDEPDAHLHPSMAKRFIDTVGNVSGQGPRCACGDDDSFPVDGSTLPSGVIVLLVPTWPHHPIGRRATERTCS